MSSTCFILCPSVGMQNWETRDRQMKPNLIGGGGTPGSHEIKGIPAYRTIFAKLQTRKNPAHPGAIIVGEIVDCLGREVSYGLERMQDPTLLPSSCDLG